MPTYVYECTHCAHRFELFQRMTDPRVEICPQCGGRVERLIGAGAGILFRGSGFYATDYRSGDYRKKAKEDGGSKPAPASPDAKKDKGAAPPAKADG
jgi:putative FmdB family regulatory protein